MMLTRRAMLGGAAAIAAANTVPTTPAHSAAPIIGKQGPSFYRYKIGEFEVTDAIEAETTCASCLFHKQPRFFLRVRPALRCGRSTR